MPPRNEQIAAMVRGELTRNPNVGNDVLLQKARAIDPRVRRLSPRQFHATYRLPALRSTAPKRAVPKAAPKPAASKPAATQAAAPAAAPAAASEPTAPAPTPAPTPAATPTPTPTKSTALARPHAAEREAVRAILQTIAREALATEDRGSFIRLLDSLDERSALILGIFGRS